METKEIKVGDYVVGFKFKNNLIQYVKDMDRYIGSVGVVKEVYHTHINILFKEDKMLWSYPKDQAIEHLCNDDMKEFEKGLDANAKDSMKALDTLVIDKTISEMLTDVENPLKETPFHKPDFNHFKDPKLYSVLLSLGKIRMVYIDQTNEDVEQIKKQSPNWHTIIIEQQQDKGIQIIIKS
jgi:hypothetical protein